MRKFICGLLVLVCVFGCLGCEKEIKKYKSIAVDRLVLGANGHKDEGNYFLSHTGSNRGGTDSLYLCFNFFYFTNAYPASGTSILQDSIDCVYNTNVTILPDGTIFAPPNDNPEHCFYIIKTIKILELRDYGNTVMAVLDVAIKYNLHYINGQFINADPEEKIALFPKVFDVYDKNGDDVWIDESLYI